MSTSAGGQASQAVLLEAARQVQELLLAEVDDFLGPLEHWQEHLLMLQSELQRLAERAGPAGCDACRSAAAPVA